MAWKFDNSLATLQCGPLTGEVDVAQPHLGLHQLRVESAPLAGRICSVERDASSNSPAGAWPAKLLDAYVRGNDLVATYHATDDWPFAPQVYWRSDTLPSIDEVQSALSLEVSVSTHLLDTHPRIFAVTELAADDVLQVSPSEDVAQTIANPCKAPPVVRATRGACCLLWRLPGGQLSYAEIVPASDFRELRVRHENGKCLASWELIAEFMEKGVIRRTRLQSALIRENATSS